MGMILLEHKVQVINESRVDSAKSRYPAISGAIDYLAKNDPSGRQKYLTWAAKMVDAGENPREVAYLVSDFHDNLAKMRQKDINAYRSLKALEDAIEQAERSVSKTQKKKEIKDSGIRKIYEDERWFIFEPLNWEASCIYGRGTKWCISAKDQPQHWPTYKGFGAAFAFIFDKSKDENDPLHKIAVTFHPPQIVQQTRMEWEDSDDWEKQQRLRGLERQFGGTITMEEMEDMVYSGSETYNAKNERMTSSVVKSLIGNNLWNLIGNSVKADPERGMPSREEMEAAMRNAGLEVPVMESLIRKYVRKTLLSRCLGKR